MSVTRARSRLPLEVKKQRQQPKRTRRPATYASTVTLPSRPTAKPCAKTPFLVCGTNPRKHRHHPE